MFLIRKNVIPIPIMKREQTVYGFYKVVIPLTAVIWHIFRNITSCFTVKVKEIGRNFAELLTTRIFPKYRKPIGSLKIQGFR